MRVCVKRIRTNGERIPEKEAGPEGKGKELSEGGVVGN